MSTVIKYSAPEEQVRTTPLAPEEIREAVDVLKALAHPIRLGIVQLLADKRSHGIDDETCCGSDEICVCKITDLFDVSMATISHHLRLLREAGLVDSRRDGAWIYYSLRREQLQKAAGSLEFIASLGSPS